MGHYHYIDSDCKWNIVGVEEEAGVGAENTDTVNSSDDEEEEAAGKEPLPSTPMKRSIDSDESDCERKKKKMKTLQQQ